MIRALCIKAVASCRVHTPSGGTTLGNPHEIGMKWRHIVGRCLREAGAACSNHATPTINQALTSPSPLPQTRLCIRNLRTLASRFTLSRRTVEKTGLLLVLTAVVGMFLLLSGCSGSSSSGASSDARVPLTKKDKQAVAELGGLGGQWLYPTSEIVRLEKEPPPGTNWAKAPCPHFVIYRTSHNHPDIRTLFIHEAQHIRDGCEAGPYWEYRAGRAVECWRRDVPLRHCVFLTREEWSET